MGWTDEEFNLAKLKWADGFSGEQIRTNFLPHKTRNSILGKLIRAGLAKGDSHVPRPRRPKSAPQLYLRPPLLPEPVVEEETFIMCLGVQLAELSEHHCKWPLEERSEREGMEHGARLYCGAIPVKGEPYCPGHFKRAHEAPRTYRQSRPKPRDNYAQFE